jgi:hypothetical protein
MRITKKKIAGAVAVSAVVALGAGTAFAYWTSTGTGSGTASVGTDKAVSINSVKADGLYPGASIPVTVNIQNDNPYLVFLANGITGSVTVDADHSGCDASNFSVSGPTPAAGIEIPKQAAATATDSDPIEWSNSSAYQINMLAKADTSVTANNQNACKGATLTITWNAI